VKKHGQILSDWKYCGSTSDLCWFLPVLNVLFSEESVLVLDVARAVINFSYCFVVMTLNSGAWTWFLWELLLAEHPATTQPTALMCCIDTHAYSIHVKTLFNASNICKARRTSSNKTWIKQNCWCSGLRFSRPSTVLLYFTFRMCER